jgi:hypothetical protein
MGVMQRFAAGLALVFVATLMLASYGHCWPMLSAQVAAVATSQTHDHTGHQKQHHHPTEGLGQELSVPAVPTGPVATVEAPAAKAFAPILLVAVAWCARLIAHDQPQPRARAGPSAFAEFHARTARLLI